MASLVQDAGIYDYTDTTVSLGVGTTQAYAGTVGEAVCLTFWSAGLPPGYWAWFLQGLGSRTVPGGL